VKELAAPPANRLQFMDINLIDGTYELFRYFYIVPSSKNASGQEIGAVRGVLGSILTMIEGGATHIGVVTDHVIESFRHKVCGQIDLVTPFRAIGIILFPFFALSSSSQSTQALV